MIIDFYKKNKKLLIFSFISILFVHLIKIVNYYPTADSIYQIKTPIVGMTYIGRWLSGISSILLSSPYDIQWVEGIVAALFASILIIFLLKIFEIKNKNYQILSIILFVTFPSFTATMVYPFWAPAYMCGFLFSVLAVYICLKTKISTIKKIILSIILFSFSLGMYQSYFPISLIILLLYIFIHICKNNNIKTIVPKIKNFLISFFGGAVLYLIINKIVLSITHIQLDDYQGISTAHFLGINKIIDILHKIIHEFTYFFLGDYYYRQHLNFFSIYYITNLLIICVLIFLLVKYIFLNNKMTVLKKVVLTLILCLIIPIGYCYYFISEILYYHQVMEFGNYFIYFILIIFLQHFILKSDKIKKIIISLLVAISIYNFYNSNITYNMMNMRYEKVYFQSIDISFKIDELLDDKKQKVAIIGGFKNTGKTIYANPIIVGTDDILFPTQYHFIEFAGYYLGKDYIGCSDNEIDEIMKTEEFKNMEIYPSKDSIKVIDEIIVVKLGEEKNEYN